MPLELTRFLGAPFRLGGRDPQRGIDCIGLVALAYDKVEVAPKGYVMRGASLSRWASELDRHFLRRIDASLKPGDIALLETGPSTWHIGIWTGDSLIHADARLGRVVETPRPLPWPIIQAWHAPIGDD